MATLEGKTAVVTGAGRGIGAATAERLAADGALVGVADIDLAAAEKVAEKIGGVALQVDVSDAASVKAGIDTLVERTGRLDIVVNSAGIVDTTAIPEIQPEKWQKVFDVNVLGTFLVCQAALPHLGEGASIINIGSRAGLVGGTTSGASYAASKAAVICLTKSLAKFAAKAGVRVNVINPGCIDTPMLDNFPESVQKDMVGQAALGRLGDASEIAATVSFLAGSDSSFMTGAQLNVNGGSHM